MTSTLLTESALKQLITSLGNIPTDRLGMLVALAALALAAYAIRAVRSSANKGDR
jgi:hypothetical protein